MDNPPADETPKGKIGKLINFLLSFAVIGAILACLGVWFFTSIFASNWRQLEPAPPGAVKIVSGSIGEVYVQDQAGQVYSCDPFRKEECWIPDVVPADPPKIENCDQSQVAFRFYQKPPQDMISCIQVHWVDPHFSGTIILALKKNGEIWEWQHGSMEYGFLLYPIGLFGGAVVGLLIGSLLWVAVRIFRLITRRQK